MKRNRPQLPNRREFMWHAACAAVGATAMATTVWDLRMINAATAQALPSSGTAADYKALVCLFLFGGNDANNLLVPTDPTGYSAYATARGSLALAQSSLLPLNPLTTDGHTYGLHASCSELQGLFNGGKLALLCNAGTLVGPVTRAQYLAKTAAVPPQLFSHNDQQVQWQTSVPDRPTRTGWGGRCADLLYSMNTNSNVSMSISLAGSNTYEVGNTVHEYAVSSSGAVGLNIPTGSSAQLKALQDLIALNHTNLYEKTYADITANAIKNNALLNSAVATAPVFTTAFPNTSLGNQLKMIAKLIYGRTNLSHKRQIFFAAVSGYDLHGAQLTPHANLLGDLSKSLKAFYDATVQLGVDSQVTTFTASDFGRTFPVNSGLGSDHGWGNHQLVLGGAVQGQKLYGRFPTLAVNGPDDTGLGRWIPTTAVDEYSATLAKWFGVSATDLRAVFPNLGRFANPDLGFLAPGV
jgi:uncharacterized protein (DUF1501 family)